MITLSCPDCGREYSLENEMAGKQAACECGAILFVPKTPDVPEGMKACSVCYAVTSRDSIICTKCGYNFQTGGRMRDATAKIDIQNKELPAFIVFVSRWWKPLFGLLFIFIALFVVYNLFFVKKFGISDKYPLGTFTAWTSYLNQCKFQKLEGVRQNIPKVFGDNIEKVVYKNVKLEKLSKGNFLEKIFFILDKNKNILAIGSNFRGGVKTIPGDVGSMTGRMMSTLWEESSLPFPPPYKHFKVGKGVYATFHNTAKVTNNNISGEWTEYPSEVIIIPSSHTMLITLKKYNKLTYKDFIISFF
jgi:DNA-directed RNA polymerase subunit RPC12/RpoP